MKKTLLASALLMLAPLASAQQPAPNPYAQPTQPMVVQPVAGQPVVVQQPAVQVQAPVQQVPVNPYAQPQYAQPQYAQPQVVANQPPAQPPASLPPLPTDFEVGVQQAMPITPEEIRLLRRMLDARQKAAAEWPNPPKSVTGSVTVSLDPGSTPAVVRPFFGVSTSLVLLDSTGAPWPVENFTVGNRTLFAVERLDGTTGSSFVISPLQTYGQSNLILKLVGHPTPVVINLVSGQKVHDARVEARVLGRGPNAQVTSVPLTAGVDSRLLSVLDGVPPQGRRLTVTGDRSSQAWMMPDGYMWLRTTMAVSAPAFVSFVSSSDGTRVYKMTPTSKVLGMQNNQFITLEVDGCLQECNSGSAVSVGGDTHW